MTPPLKAGDPTDLRIMVNVSECYFSSSIPQNILRDNIIKCMLLAQVYGGHLSSEIRGISNSGERINSHRCIHPEMVRSWASSATRGLGWSGVMMLSHAIQGWFLLMVTDLQCSY
jgi:hypothetical protein